MSSFPEYFCSVSQSVFFRFTYDWLKKLNLLNILTRFVKRFSVTALLCSVRFPFVVAWKLQWLQGNLTPSRTGPLWWARLLLEVVWWFHWLQENLTPSSFMYCSFVTSRIKVGNSPGAKEQGSHKIFRLTQCFCGNPRCFAANLNYFHISCQMKDFFPSHTTLMKYQLPQEERACSDLTQNPPFGDNLSSS